MGRSPFFCSQAGHRIIRRFSCRTVRRSPVGLARGTGRSGEGVFRGVREVKEAPVPGAGSSGGNRRMVRRPRGPSNREAPEGCRMGPAPVRRAGPSDAFHRMIRQVRGQPGTQLLPGAGLSGDSRRMIRRLGLVPGTPPSSSSSPMDLHRHRRGLPRGAPT